VKKKLMTMKELHAYKAVACTNCGKSKEEHLAVMVPDTTQFRCLDANVLSEDFHKEYTAP
jgi:hypothetical protein